MGSPIAATANFLNGRGEHFLLEAWTQWDTRCFEAAVSVIGLRLRAVAREPLVRVRFDARRHEESVRVRSASMHDEKPSDCRLARWQGKAQLSCQLWLLPRSTALLSWYNERRTGPAVRQIIWRHGPVSRGHHWNGGRCPYGQPCASTTLARLHVFNTNVRSRSDHVVSQLVDRVSC